MAAPGTRQAVQPRPRVFILAAGWDSPAGQAVHTGCLSAAPQRFVIGSNSFRTLTCFEVPLHSHCSLPAKPASNRCCAVGNLWAGSAASAKGRSAQCTAHASDADIPARSNAAVVFRLCCSMSCSLVAAARGASLEQLLLNLAVLAPAPCRT